MKHLILLFALSAVVACGDNSAVETETASGGEATELRDWAMSQTSRAEITTKLAEAKMTLRVVAQADPQSDQAKELTAKIAELEQQLADLENSARQ